MATLTVLEVPQWQGSGSRTAHRLRDGSATLARMFPADERVVAAVDPAPGRPDGAVAALDVLAANLRACRAALTGAGKDLVVTVGGDCGVELAPIEAALAVHGQDLAVVWFDAHADLNTPASSPSGAFHGMVLRTLLGEGPAELAPTRTLRPRQVVLAGVRALDPAERSFVRDNGISHVGVDQFADPAELVAAVAATGARAVYVHLDLDVLDPEVFAAVGCAQPRGLAPDQLVAAVRALTDRFALAGAGVTEYEPDRPGDHELLARVVTALVPALRSVPPADDDVAAVERHAAAAWPAGHAELTDGWLLRHTPGRTPRRCNSALPPPAHVRPERALDTVEAFYRSRGLPPLVQVSPVERHTGLDAVLAGREYRRVAPTLVLTAPVSEVLRTAAEAPALTVHVAARATPAWCRAYLAQGGHSDVVERVLPLLPAPTAYVSADLDGEPAGIGLLVASSGWAGVFCMSTAPRRRGRGVATAVLRAGARWAAGNGADGLYLQVEQDNEPARRLYGRVGFTASHSYHYRVADLSESVDAPRGRRSGGGGEG